MDELVLSAIGKFDNRAEAMRLAPPPRSARVSSGLRAPCANRWIVLAKIASRLARDIAGVGCNANRPFRCVIAVMPTFSLCGAVEC
jgi:hypothetical protein